MKKLSLLNAAACALGLFINAAYALPPSTIEFRNIGPNFDQTSPIAISAGTVSFLTCTLSPKLSSGNISVYGLSITPPTVGMSTTSSDLNVMNNAQTFTAGNDRVRGYLTATSNFGSAQIRIKVDEGGIMAQNGRQMVSIRCESKSKHI